MFYVTIIVRKEYDNLYLEGENIQIFKAQINFVSCKLINKCFFV